MKPDYEQLHLKSDGKGGILFYCTKISCPKFGESVLIHYKCGSYNQFLDFAATHIRDYHQELME